MKMKLLIFVLISAQAVWGQDEIYFNFIKQADSLYTAKDFLNAGYAFSSAFQSNGWKGRLRDRYKAGRSWAQAGCTDSAFFNLQRISLNGRYKDHDFIFNDPMLVSLHADDRWEPLLEVIKTNKANADAKLDMELVTMLNSIQELRMQQQQQEYDVYQKSGIFSQDLQNQNYIRRVNDSIHLSRVLSILDSRGWPGDAEIREGGGQTIAMILSLADIKTREKYLPMLRDAVKLGKTSGETLASYEDDLSSQKYGRQIYGSNVRYDQETQQYYVGPLEDPDNVDKRRKEIGIQPLGEYLKYFKIKWDVETYKKELPKWLEVEKKRKAGKKRK